MVYLVAVSQFECSYFCHCQWLIRTLLQIYDDKLHQRRQTWRINKQNILVNFHIIQYFCLFRRICCLYLDAFNISLRTVLSLYFCHSIDRLACSLALALSLCFDCLKWLHLFDCAIVAFIVGFAILCLIALINLFINQERLNYIFLSILTWLINTLLNTNEKHISSCVCVLCFGIEWDLSVLLHAAQSSHLLGMISCAPDHTHTPSHGEWKSLILKIHTWKRKCKRQRLSSNIFGPQWEWLTDQLYLNWLTLKHSIAHTQIIKMKTNKQPF